MFKVLLPHYLKNGEYRYTLDGRDVIDYSKNRLWITTQGQGHRQALQEAYEKGILVEQHWTRHKCGVGHF